MNKIYLSFTFFLILIITTQHSAKEILIYADSISYDSQSNIIGKGNVKIISENEVIMSDLIIVNEKTNKITLPISFSYKDNKNNYYFGKSGEFSNNFDNGIIKPLNSGEEEGPRQREYLTEVVVQRLKGARFPVDVLMVFDDGEKIRMSWDGQDRWEKYSFQKPTRLEYASVDPDRKLLLDINPTNNSRYRATDKGFALATKKWASKWLFWLQNLLETIAFMA